LPWWKLSALDVWVTDTTYSPYTFSVSQFAVVETTYVPTADVFYVTDLDVTASPYPEKCFVSNLDVNYTVNVTRPVCSSMEEFLANTKGYRYGFNGKEDDKEVEGEQDYGMRIYDKRLGRFKSVDPLTRSFPSLSVYQYASNSPISNIDYDGLEAMFFMLVWDKQTCKVVTYKFLDAKLETLFGTIDFNFVHAKYIYGSDGHWHEVPKEWENKSLNSMDDRATIEKTINSWKQSDMAYEAAMLGEKLQELGQKADVAMSLAMLVAGVANVTFKGISALRGKDYEDFLSKNLKGGTKGFSSGGRDFDGSYLDRKIWYEAKSGNYWRDQTGTVEGFNKFKSDMGDRLRIAKENGVEYQLFSNSKIPDKVKQFLDKKGIKYFETLD